MGNAKGAWAASVIYSLVITAKANNLDPFQYLENAISKIPYCERTSDFEALLPTK